MSEPGTSLSPANAVLSAVGLLPTLISGDFTYESGGRDTSLQIGRVPPISGELTGMHSSVFGGYTETDMQMNDPSRDSKSPPAHRMCIFRKPKYTTLTPSVKIRAYNG